MAMKKELLAAVACPKCNGDVKVKGMFVVCNKCELAYPVLENNIPSMVTDDVWRLEKAKKAGFKHKEKL